MTNYVAPYVATAATTLSGGESIALTTSHKEVCELVSVEFNWTAGTAPTTADNIVITKDAGDGTGYDNVYATINPSSTGGLSAHKLVWTPRPEMGPIILQADDEVKVAYTNTDDLAITVTVTLEDK